MSDEKELKWMKNYNTGVNQLLYLVNIGEGLRPTVPISTYTASESVFPGEIGLTPRAKKVIELAVDETSCSHAVLHRAV